MKERTNNENLDIILFARSRGVGKSLQYTQGHVSYERLFTSCRSNRFFFMNFAFVCGEEGRVKLLNIYNLCSQLYPLEKFQLHMPNTLGVTTLQSSNNRKIDLYSKYRENKLQALTKTVVTYQQIEVQS